jgi:hypothetical protein
VGPAVAHGRVRVDALPDRQAHTQVRLPEGQLQRRSWLRWLCRHLRRLRSGMQRLGVHQRVRQRGLATARRWAVHSVGEPRHEIGLAPDWLCSSKRPTSRSCLNAACSAAESPSRGSLSFGTRASSVSSNRTATP